MARTIGEVTGLHTGTPPLVTVTLDSGETAADVPYLDSYAPAVGDTVHIDAVKGDLLVLGAVDSSDAASLLKTQTSKVTANSASTSGTTAITVAGISDMQVRSGHRYRADAQFRSISGDTAGDVYTVWLEIVDDTTLVAVTPVLAAVNIRVQTSATGQDGAALWAWFDVDGGSSDLDLPYANGFRLRLRMQRAAGGGTAFMQGAATYPTRVMVTDVGSAG